MRVGGTFTNIECPDIGVSARVFSKQRGVRWPLYAGRYDPRDRGGSIEPARLDTEG